MAAASKEKRKASAGAAATMMKRRRGSSIISSYFKEEEKEGYGTISTLVPCGSLLRNVTRTICFWGYQDKYRTEIDWYVIKLSKYDDDLQQQHEVRKLAAFDHMHLHNEGEVTEEEEPTLNVFSYVKKREGGDVPLWGCSFTTLGPFLYSVGGSFYYRTMDYGSLHTSPKQHRNRTNLVHYFDTTNAKAGWIKAPSMITPRISPQVISINHKLYVFGCSKGARKCRHEPRCLVWAEVFDPSVGLWAALPEPPFSKTLFICSANHLNNHHTTNKIMVIADKRKVYELDTFTNQWACKFEFLTPWKGNENHQPVLVGDILYWFDADIHAYDIRNDKFYRGPVQDFSFQRCMRTQPPWYDFTVGEYKPAIFHLGGSYFCLLAYEDSTNSNGCHNDTSKHIHCLTIKVSRTKECYKRYGVPGLDISEFFLRGAVMSCQSFPIDGRRVFLDGRFITI